VTWDTSIPAKIASLYGRNKVFDPIWTSQEFYMRKSDIQNINKVDDFRPISSFSNLVLNGWVPVSLPV